MQKRKVEFMCTAFRDGFQSVFGARVFTKDFIPAVEATAHAGVRYFEAGGGARFQSLFFYSNENAFDMMDAFREAAGPDANLQTLGRGVNVVGLESQSSDIIDLHAKLFKKHGMTTIRNFDALNDINNLIFPGQTITDAGLRHQISITMMELPPGCCGAHDAEFYIKTLRDILDSGVPFDSVCFKDASGTSVPSKVYETIRQARKLLPQGSRIHFHTHETAGIGVLANKAALDGGADLIDLSMAPCSGGTCQTDILTMWHALRDTEYDLDVDVEKIREAEELFKECMKEYFLPPEATRVEPIIPWSPMPGGALTANTQMLRDNGLMEKYDEMIRAMGEVVARGGYGTSVTPVSQFYFQQAFNNVMFGPWKKIAEGYGKMVLGYFGKTPVPPDPEIIKLAAQQLKRDPTDRTPIEINDADPQKGVAAARRVLEEAGLEISDENIFIAATCKEKGIAYLKGEATVGVRKIDRNREVPTEADSGCYTVTVDGKEYALQINGDRVIVNDREFCVNMCSGTQIKKENRSGSGLTEVRSQTPGQILRILRKVGDAVKKDDVILVLEAMKMEIEVSASVSGKIAEILVSVGQQVASDQVLVRIE